MLEKASYYPQISGVGIYTGGLPASSGELRIGGVTGSAFRKGPSLGLVLEQNLWDFGQTSSKVRIKERKTDLVKEEESISSFNIKTQVIELFYTCAKDRSLSEVINLLLKDVRLIEIEVGKFVKTGQDSVVDKFLARELTEEVNTEADSLQKKYEMDLKALQYFINDKESQTLCPSLTENLIPQKKDDLTQDLSKNPYVRQADAELKLSAAELESAKTQYWPKLIGLASYGYIHETQVSELKKHNYALAVGLKIPIFEGFAMQYEVDRAHFARTAKEDKLRAVQFDLENSLNLIDRNIESARIANEHLEVAVDAGSNAFHVAQTRYMKKKVTLVICVRPFEFFFLHKSNFSIHKHYLQVNSVTNRFC